MRLENKPNVTWFEETIREMRKLIVGRQFVEANYWCHNMGHKHIAFDKNGHQQKEHFNRCVSCLNYECAPCESDCEIARILKRTKDYA